MNENEQLDTGATPVRDWVELDAVATLPDPGNLEGWAIFERNSHSVEVPDVGSGGNIHDPT